MTEKQARDIAAALGGETWQSGGGVWLVILKRADGRAVAVSEEAVCEYRDLETLETGQPDKAILLC